MNNTIQYKGYVGSVEFSEEDGIFYGKVMGDSFPDFLRRRKCQGTSGRFSRCH